MPKSRLINYPNNQPVRIFTELCRLYEKGDSSFYNLLDFAYIIIANFQ